jgi:hypothetical protein
MLGYATSEQQLTQDLACFEAEVSATSNAHQGGTQPAPHAGAGSAGRPTSASSKGPQSCRSV